MEAKIAQEVTPHTFRHTYASHLYQNGTDILKIQQLLGHSNITNTLIYTHFTSKQVQDHINPLDMLELSDENQQRQLDS